MVKQPEGDNIGSDLCSSSRTLTAAVREFCFASGIEFYQGNHSNKLKIWDYGKVPQPVFAWGALVEAESRVLLLFLNYFLNYQNSCFIKVTEFY
jgi:hypothetical protein